MFMLLNTLAAGGRAQERWRRILCQREDLGRESNTVAADLGTAALQKVREALCSGEKDFVAVGGDGTVNALLNLLIVAASPDQRASLCLGAIGIGSSNDFHKPFKNDRMLAGIPYALDFRRAVSRDVGRIVYEKSGKDCTRYFLINASIGVTAEANLAFNNPDWMLRFLKQSNVNTAIAYAALRTIIVHQNRLLQLSSWSGGRLCPDVANLAVLKNPHVSGSLSFGGDPHYNDSKFRICLAHSMNRRKLCGLLWSLWQGHFPSSPTCVSWRTATLSASSPEPFAVEFDGEVVSTTAVQFDVLPDYLKVCP